MKKIAPKTVALQFETRQTLMSTGLILGLMLILLLSGCTHRARQGGINNDTMAVAPPNGSVTITATVAASEGAVTETPATDKTDESVDEAFADDFEDAFEKEQITVADPLEPINRAIFAFNDKLYFWVLQPATKAFKAVVPEEIRTSTGNALRNIKAPIRIANSILQGKFKQAGTEFGRFFINSTAGVLGFGDPAAQHPVFEHDREDLGQTLAVWGFSDGIYLVLPFFGPSTLRDAVGKVGDTFLNPLRYVLDDSVEEAGVAVYEPINELSFRLEQYEAVKKGSLDPYVFMKNAYLQIRREKIAK